jgi:hypothetical protein
MSNSEIIRADLHNHSTCSDGELRPAEVIEQAAAKGLEAVALTDHDTVAGLEEALAAGRRCGIEVIAGTELTLRMVRREFTGSLHLLLYFRPEKLDNRDFIRELTELFSAGRGPGLVRARVESINRFFGPAGRKPLLKRELAAAELEELGSNLTRRHFALVLEKKHGLKKRQVEKIIGNRSPAYLPSGVSLQEFTIFRQRNSFLSFLAHPAAGSFPPPSHYREVLPPWPVVAKILPELLPPYPVALDGLEIEYPGHLAKHRRILRELAEKHRLLISGGSDGHDFRERPYGVCGIGQEDLARLRAALAKLG